VDIAFFMPQQYLPDRARQDGWKSGNGFSLLASGKAACVQCWIFQTWLNLERRGFPVKLVTEFPSKGIVVALTGTLAEDFVPPPEVFLIGVVADGLPHRAADLLVLQNPEHARRLPRAVYVPLWTQPHLLPRDPRRGDVFRRICFYGDPANLAPELAGPSFAATLKAMHNLDFETLPATRWSDYSETDCVLGIRSFAAKRHLHKPPTKLANAWLAGVPFLGGAESALLGVGSPGENFLLCRSVNDVLSSLQLLSENPELRHGLVAAGTRAAHDFSREAIEDRWVEILRSCRKERLPLFSIGRSLRLRLRGMRLTWDRLTMD
jgi:hypothetical protein